jgi:hypothetical protein
VGVYDPGEHGGVVVVAGLQRTDAELDPAAVEPAAAAGVGIQGISSRVLGAGEDAGIGKLEAGPERALDQAAREGVVAVVHPLRLAFDHRLRCVEIDESGAVEDGAALRRGGNGPDHFGVGAEPLDRQDRVRGLAGAVGEVDRVDRC